MENLDDVSIEKYARQHTHANFFDRLAQQKLKVLSWSVERLPGLCIVINLKMAEDVKKRAITEIIQKYTGSEKGKKIKKEENVAVG